MSDDSVVRPEKAPNPHSIARISVEKLFGQFTYNLPVRNGTPQDLSNLFILYGDNGSGKTTILRLLYNLLASVDGKGHKTTVSTIRFRRFAVELADGTTIEALRPGKSQEGVYRAAILKGAETIDSIDFPSGVRTGGEVTDEEKGRVRSFLRKLQGFRLGLQLLPDDRRIQGRDEGNETHLRHVYRTNISTSWNIIGEPSVQEDSLSLMLKGAVDRAGSWIRQQALTGSNKGQRGVHSIYTDITKHIVESLESETPESVQSLQIEELVEKLTSLSRRSEAYAELGLTSEMPVGDIIGSLGNATMRTRPILYNVIRPYVQSVEARLKALEGIHTLVQRFVGNVNTFFSSTKHLSYDIRQGFAIHTKNGEPLPLEMLSSGERQLMLLMCNTLAARDQATILLIDEPEISLNIKWQRQLVQALLDCITGSNAQLIFATHSIELLAKHQSQVVKLVDMSDGEKPPRVKDNPDEPRRPADDRRVGSEV